MAGGDKGLLDGVGAYPADQQIGGHVVTGGDHLAGRLAHCDA